MCTDKLLLHFDHTDRKLNGYVDQFMCLKSFKKINALKPEALLHFRDGNIQI